MDSPPPPGTALPCAQGRQEAGPAGTAVSEGRGEGEGRRQGRRLRKGINIHRYGHLLACRPCQAQGCPEGEVRVLPSPAASPPQARVLPACPRVGRRGVGQRVRSAAVAVNPSCPPESHGGCPDGRMAAVSLPVVWGGIWFMFSHDNPVLCRFCCQSTLPEDTTARVIQHAAMPRPIAMA